MRRSFLLGMAASCVASWLPGQTAKDRAYPILAEAFSALRVKEYDAAIAGFVRALDLTPARNDVRKNLAYTYFKTGKNELARRQFSEIVRRDSSDESAALELAFLDFESIEPAQRAVAYQLFSRLRSARDTAIRSRAFVAFTNVDTSLALRMSQMYQAMRVEPENNLMSANFARAAEERGRTRLAEEYYRGSANEESMSDWLSVARLARAQGRTRDAEAAEQKVIEGRNPFLAEVVREEAAARRGLSPRATHPPAAAPRAPASGYVVVGGSAASWPAVLTAGGYTSEDGHNARIVVLRQDSARSPADWAARVREGTFLILEGPSAVAQSMGFRATGDSVNARVELDVHSADQTILWEHPARVPRVQLPSQATVFTRERWTDAPLLAGYRMGKGAVLWVATNPGAKGFERLPYFLLALSDLGMTPAVRGRELHVLMDWSYRTRADPEYLAHQWREMGVGAVHISAWYFFERNPGRDSSLRAFIDAAHRNGIVTYAWFQFPHVSDQFWNDHPEWREKNALLQDAAIYWRKNMNLANPDAFKAVAAGVTDLLTHFDFDGANLSELYFEGPIGLANLAEVSPLNAIVRRDIRTEYGFDPADLFDAASPRYYPGNPEGLKQYQDYRVQLQYKLHVQFLDLFAAIRKQKGSLGVTVLYLDDIFEPRMRELVGADARRILALIPKYDFTFILEDAAMFWGLGPDRYSRMAEQYAPVTSHSDKLAVDINIVARPVISFPTNQQTGSEFLELVNVAQKSFRTVMLYAENSVLPPDVPMLSPAAASVTSMRIRPDTITVNSEHGVGVRWSGAATVDGAPWPYVDGSFAWVPRGPHVITRPLARMSSVPTHLLDFNGVLDSLSTTAHGLSVAYSADARAIAIVDQSPSRILIDGQPATVKMLSRPGATVVLLPSGKHRVELITH